MSDQKLEDQSFVREWMGEKDFKFIKQLDDPRFGEINVKKNAETGEVIFTKDYICSNLK